MRKFLIMLLALVGVSQTIAQNHSDANYHFLVWDRDELYILKWNGEQSSLTRLSDPFLDSLNMVYANTSRDGYILLVAVFGLDINLALLDRDGSFISYLTQLDPLTPTWTSLDITPDNQYMVMNAEIDLHLIEGLNNFELDEPISQRLRLANGIDSTISYDGRYIAYDEGAGADEYSLELIDLGENYQYIPNSEITITSELQPNCFRPDFHPSEYKIAYFCAMPAYNSESIFITNIVTAETELIFTPPDSYHINSCVRWSPDGERLAFNSRDTMYILTLETMELEEIPVDVSILSDGTMPICPVWLNW